MYPRALPHEIDIWIDEYSKTNKRIKIATMRFYRERKF